MKDRGPGRKRPGLFFRPFPPAQNPESPRGKTVLRGKRILMTLDLPGERMMP